MTKTTLPGIPGIVAPRAGGPVLQRMESDGDYVDPSEIPKTKQERYNFLTATPENVIRATAHSTVHFDKTKYNAVFTCRNCGMMLAFEDTWGSFTLTKYVYMSKSGKLHSGERALELDHHPTWNKRLKKHKKDGTSRDERREDYQDESKLRAICTNCNASHELEGWDIPDYDSSEEDYDPERTPKHETQYNTGLWSGYRDPKWLS